MLCECAVMVALATVLSLIKIEFPYGGSITICSMLPILIIGYRYKPLVGCLTGVVYGLIQMLFGMSNFAYATSWQAALMILFFDYLIAFGVIGLGGVFRGIKNQAVGLALGALLASVLRFLCHFSHPAPVSSVAFQPRSDMNDWFHTRPSLSTIS